MNIDREQFEAVVNEAMESLPEKFKKKLHNVAIMIEDFPSPEQRRKLGLRSKHGLFGLYEGYIQSSRRNVGPVLPDKITIFRIHILRSGRIEAECRNHIISTVKHEIAHHFGSDEKGARRASIKRT